MVPFLTSHTTLNFWNFAVSAVSIAAFGPVDEDGLFFEIDEGSGLLREGVHVHHDVRMLLSQASDFHRLLVRPGAGRDYHLFAVALITVFQRYDVGEHAAGGAD